MNLPATGKSGRDAAGLVRSHDHDRRSAIDKTPDLGLSDGVVDKGR
jgi:hypothetical protein